MCGGRVQGRTGGHPGAARSRKAFGGYAVAPASIKWPRPESHIRGGECAPPRRLRSVAMSYRELIPRPLKRLVRPLLDRIPLKLEVSPLRSEWHGERRRFDYQRRHVGFDIRPGERVLDIGSGGDPFPHATLLADRFMEPT